MQLDPMIASALVGGAGVGAFPEEVKQVPRLSESILEQEAEDDFDMNRTPLSAPLTFSDMQIFTADMI